MAAPPGSMQLDAPRARRPLRPFPFWLAMWMSVAVHALIAGAIWLYQYGGGRLEGGGELGLEGAGDDELEISVIEGRLAPPTALPDPETRADATERSEAEAAPQREREVLTVRDRGAGSAPREPAPAPAEELAEAAAEQELAPSVASSGVGHPEGDDATRRGRAAGDLGPAEVILGSLGLGLPTRPGPRALLERALECDDPVEGVWVAHRYSPEFHDWARMTLRIDREGEQLRGTITARMWMGLATDRRPPPCTNDRSYDYSVRMEARGTLRGTQMSFGADTHRILRVDCPSSFFSYLPDHFTGELDPVRETLETVNNDGVRDVNAPYHFRRTGCLDPADE